MTLNFSEEEKKRISKINKDSIDKILGKLSEISPICSKEFYAMPENYTSDDFDAAWRMYSENTILGFCNEDYYLEDYLNSINVDDFVDWILNS